jgi:stearoyl-CoA desaturase (delta-9 desaturase)
MFWFTTEHGFATNIKNVPDLAKWEELRFLDRFDWLVPAVLAVTLFLTGHVLFLTMPELGTNGFQMLVWGFIVSTIVLFHGTCLINSAAHLMGKQRFNTGDQSRNSFILSVLTLGEGWHNNHHYYPGAVRQGFYWWEFDPTFYGLKLLEKLGLIWDLNPVPERILAEGAGRPLPQGEAA